MRGKALVTVEHLVPMVGRQGIIGAPNSATIAFRIAILGPATRLVIAGVASGKLVSSIPHERCVIEAIPC